jgi:cytochrome c-type protein NapC
MSQPPKQPNDARTWRGSKRHLGWAAAALVFLAGIASVGAIDFAIQYTNTTEFCTSCHTMQANFAEYKESMHFQNPSGIQATCADCHVPQELGPKLLTKIVAAKDVFHEVVGTIDTPEKFEARRWIMANRIWDKMKSTDSRECRTCHDFANMELSAQDRSARNKHSRAEDKGETCIDCHKGIVHALPDEPESAESTPADPETTETTEKDQG